MTKYQAIIFDMNGVIVDDEPIHVIADKRTCEAFGLVVPATEWPKVKGWKSYEIFEYLVKQYADRSIDINQMIAHKTTEYLKLTAEQLVLVPGVIEFIKFCKQRFSKIALATSTLKVLQKFVFDKFELAEYFQVIITAEDLIRGKPDPDAYLQAAAKLGVATKDCLVIEDSINGVMSGKRAGMKVLAITTSYSKGELEQAGADFIYENFEQVIKNKHQWL